MKTLTARIERIERRVLRDEVPQLVFTFGDENEDRDEDGERVLRFDFGHGQDEKRGKP